MDPTHPHQLGDFGLAKDNVTDSTFGAQSVCGTPEYMAPEVKINLNVAGYGVRTVIELSVDDRLALQVDVRRGS